MQADLKAATELIKDRLYLLCARSVSSFLSSPNYLENYHFIAVDDKHVYQPFYRDFGPVHLGHTVLFCKSLHKLMNDTELSGKRIVVLTSYDGGKRANAAYLVCAYMLICQRLSPEEAYRPFNNAYPPFIPFRDASQSISTFNLTILDCLKGINKAMMHGFFNFDNFHIEEYFHYEKVENGDMNWIIPGRFLAFSSPASRRISPDGMVHFTPDDYIPIFRNWNITAVIRLNKKLYDARQFTRHGIYHEELFYPDGGLPPEDVLRKFLHLVDEWFLGTQIKGAFAVHCKAGLGRTGTLIGLYMMKYYRFTATEAIAWLRICRPGSVIGIQQHYLKEMQLRMWREGEAIWKSNFNLISEPIPMEHEPNSTSFASRNPRTVHSTRTSGNQTHQSPTFEHSEHYNSSPVRNRLVNGMSSIRQPSPTISSRTLRTSLAASHNAYKSSSNTSRDNHAITSSPLRGSSASRISANSKSVVATSIKPTSSIFGSSYEHIRAVPSSSFTPPPGGRGERDSRRGLHASLSTGKFESHLYSGRSSSASSHKSYSPAVNNLSSTFADMSINRVGQAPIKREHHLSSFSSEKHRDNFLLRGTTGAPGLKATSSREWGFM